MGPEPAPTVAEQFSKNSLPKLARGMIESVVEFVGASRIHSADALEATLAMVEFTLSTLQYSD